MGFNGGNGVGGVMVGGAKGNSIWKGFNGLGDGAGGGEGAGGVDCDGGGLGKAFALEEEAEEEVDEEARAADEAALSIESRLLGSNIDFVAW